MSHKELLSKLVHDMITNEVRDVDKVNSMYLGSVASSLAAIADSLEDLVEMKKAEKISNEESGKTCNTCINFRVGENRPCSRCVHKSNWKPIFDNPDYPNAVREKEIFNRVKEESKHYDNSTNVK